MGSADQRGPLAWALSGSKSRKSLPRLLEHGLTFLVVVCRTGDGVPSVAWQREGNAGWAREEREGKGKGLFVEFHSSPSFIHPPIHSFLLLS